MRKLAYLTIDDGPSEDTPKNVDLLLGKGIPAIMFFTGRNIDRFPEEAAYAVKSGIVVGNHSASHPFFSSLRFDQAVNEISAQEERIDELYGKAGRPRPAKLFRFPYGDKGGENKDAIQDFLGESGFGKLNTSGIRQADFLEPGKGADIDVYWTYDACDYKFLEPEKTWTEGQYVQKLDQMKFKSRDGLFGRASLEVILIHDLPAINASLPGYFAYFLEKLSERGVEFRRPRFAEAGRA